MDIKIKFCKQCFKKRKYSILNYEIKDIIDEIQYKCAKDNEIKKEDIVEIKLTDFLRKKLIYCEKHKDKRCSAWCNKCKKNICFLCINQEKHDYKLYCQFTPSIKVYDLFLNIIKEFLYIRIEYNYYLPKFIDDLNKIIYLYELYYKLYKEDNIINYQILLNLQYNINNYQKFIDKFKQKIFNEIIKLNEMKNINKKNQVNLIQLPLTKIYYSNQYLDIISLDLKPEISDEEKIIYINNKIENNISKKPFVIYYKYLYCLEFYDNKGKYINQIKEYMVDRCDAFLFIENILIFIKDFKILFLYISSNMLEYQFSHEFNFEFNYMVGCIKGIFKMNDSYIGYFFSDHFYYIELGDEQKIFRKDIPLEQDAIKYFNVTNSYELIGQKLAQIIPYYDENNSLKFIGISFIYEIITSSFLNDNYTFRFKMISKIFYGIPINFKKTLNPKKKEEKDKMKINIIIFSDFPFIDNKFEISVLPNDNDIFFQENLDQERFIIDHFKDNLLLFLFKNAYQINLKTNQIVNIYELYSTKIIGEYGKFYYEIKDNEYKRIVEDELKENLFHNENKIIKVNYISQYRKYEKKVYNNFKDNLILKSNKGDILTCIDLEEARIIEFLKINLKLNGNEIIIYFANKNIKFYSIINPNIYKLLFPDFIEN